VAAFVKHEPCPNCGSSDNLAVYSDGSYFCFSHCGYKSVSEDWLEANADGKPYKSSSNVRSHVGSEKKEVMEVKSTKPALSEEENAKIKSETSTKGNLFRNLRDDITAPFGVRYSYNEDTGEVNHQYYPCTQDGQLVGYKIREVPKGFYSKGRTGADCELFGQFKFNRGGKYVVITEGELDCLSAYQMISDYNKKRGSDFEVAVVSPTTGAQSKKQIASQYKFLDSFDNIITSFDNDKAGKEAAEELMKYLPKGKVKVMQMRYKDANEYLQKGKDKEFIQDFYDAKKPVPVGVLPSDQLYERLMQQAHTEKLPWPAFMGNLNEFFKGGLPLGHIVNIAAATSVGKTTLINELLYFWIFNSPHKCGIVSMELDAGQYAEALLSRHLNRKLVLISDEQEKVDYLQRPDVKEKAYQLLKDENNDPRFYLLDNRDGTVEEIQNTVEELVVACGCKVIIIDVLQDIIASLPNEEQEMFLKWSKSLIKSHGITLVYINHTRKTSAGQNAADDEQSVHGSSSIIKSASVNIMLKRDKMAEDPVVRNKTEILVHKNRIFGITGPAGAVYYDNETHTLHNFDAWMNEHMI
jgi:KaiC/GvpD/RAD55 family RecA-like ATPase/ribosomal protein S27AE